MAFLTTPQDIAAFVNSWQQEAIGSVAIQLADTSNLVDAGTAIMQTGLENTINSFWMLLGKIRAASKKYNGKMSVLRMTDESLLASRWAKVSVYSRKAIASGFYNTDLYTNFAPGYDNTSNSGASVKSMWEQAPAITDTFFFGSSRVYDFQAPTFYIDKLELAFRDGSEMARVVNACALEFENDLTQYEENMARALLVNRIAADIDQESDRPESVIHCVTEFNQTFDVSYTLDELLSTYAKDFYTWLAAKMDQVMERFTERSLLYHWSPEKQVSGVDYDLLRFTPREDLKIALNNNTFIALEKYVLPEVFHDNLLRVGQYERVNYWQNIKSPDEIKCTPAIIDTDSSSDTYKTQIKGDAVNKRVIAVMWNRDAMGAGLMLKRALTSPVEARKGYYNSFVHYNYSFWSDTTEPSAVFVLD